MNQQESQLLQNFLNQMVQARNVQKDPEAEAMIASAVARQPDAAYLLVQRSMLMEQALEAAKAQIAALQNQVQAPNRGFLDSANAWGNHPAPVARQAPPQAPYGGAPQLQPQAGYQPQPPQYAPPPQAASPGLFGGRAGSFLGSAAATAAGVAGGAFLFQGIENLLGHHGGSGFMNPQAAGGFGQPIENTTVNNYYIDDSNASGGSDRSDFSSDNSDFVPDDSSNYSADPGSDDDSFI